MTELTTTTAADDSWDILATIRKNKKALTTVAINDVTEFSHSVEKSASSREGDLVVWGSLNGERTILAFVQRPRKGDRKGFTFMPSRHQFPVALKAQVDLLSWLTMDVEHDGALTLAEVRSRAATLAGIWLTAKTLELPMAELA